MVACIASPEALASFPTLPGTPPAETYRPSEAGGGSVELGFRCIGLHKSFKVRGSGLRARRSPVLKGLDLEVRMGESVAIVGESGSGKSTLLRVLAGLLDYDSGELSRDGGRLQMLFQDAGASLTPWMTVGKLLAEPLGLTSPPVPRSERRLRVTECLRSVGLPADVAQVKSSTLSGGQQQRVAFARAVIVPPSLLLCDEPTSALDASLAAVVLNLLRSLRQQFQMSVVFVTHDLAVARIVADRIAVISEGQVVEIGPTERVIKEPQHPYTRELIAAVPTLPLAKLARGQMTGEAGSEQAGAV